MKPLTLTGLRGASSMTAAGSIGRDAAVAADNGLGALCAVFAILAGLIKTGAADGPAMRAYLQSLYDELGLAERHTAMGLALSR